MSLCNFPTFNFSITLPSIPSNPLDIPAFIAGFLGASIPDFSINIDTSCPLD